MCSDVPALYKKDQLNIVWLSISPTDPISVIRQKREELDPMLPAAQNAHYLLARQAL